MTMKMNLQRRLLQLRLPSLVLLLKSKARSLLLRGLKSGQLSKVVNTIPDEAIEENGDKSATPRDRSASIEALHKAIDRLESMEDAHLQADFNRDVAATEAPAAAAVPKPRMRSESVEMLERSANMLLQRVAECVDGLAEEKLALEMDLKGMGLTV